MTVQTVALLAVGTYLLRWCGPLVHGRVDLSPRFQTVLSASATALLCAMAAVSALTTGHGFAGWARPLGVLAGVVLALRGVSFLVVVVVAATITALLRLAGVS
ncbi:AzlD domain-containing protein [Streptomyces caatingaensis]|uniref:Branched-chain amino acid transporter n=1 Tax=Streptomyces caatingaensis TaxID=1678637 RepID=A0A0K9XL98_9ACTN|nr:AzlD domain-containing protein [Streptomyces caatingaensis]KNB54154.1 branched-chain amino acid transporter [Streptomyces caatingaensis]